MHIAACTSRQHHHQRMGGCQRACPCTRSLGVANEQGKNQGKKSAPTGTQQAAFLSSEAL